MCPERFVAYVSGMDRVTVATSAGFEPTTPSLGRRRSIP